jgi:succinoglycan biosynthesis transport protein ExoP
VPNPEPVSPKPLRAGIVGGFIGLIIGLALAVMRERLDLRVREPQQFEDAFGRPIIGRIPDSSALSKSSLQASLPPVEGQAFRDLRANLRHAVGDRDARSVVITSAIPSEGKTTVAWNLAREAAGAGARVLLVEADLRRPGLSVKLGTEPGAGLSDYIQGLATLEQATRQLPIPSTSNGDGHTRVIDIVFAGSPPRDATGLLESDRMAWFLDHAAMIYDLVVIDTPPLSVASDAVPLIGRVSGVIVVGRLETTTRGAMGELCKQLTNLDAHVLGIVVNSSGVPRDTYRYYYRGVPA